MAQGTEAAQELVLTTLFGEGTMVGLGRSGKEIEDAGYERRPLKATVPTMLRDTGYMAVGNSLELRYGPWASDAPGALTDWLIFSGDGELLAQGDLTPAYQPTRGQEVVLRPRRLILALK